MAVVIGVGCVGAVVAGALPDQNGSGTPASSPAAAQASGIEPPLADFQATIVESIESRLDVDLTNISFTAMTADGDLIHEAAGDPDTISLLASVDDGTRVGVLITRSREYAGPGATEAHCADGLSAGFWYSCSVSATDSGLPLVVKTKATTEAADGATEVIPVADVAAFTGRLEFERSVKVVKDDSLVVVVRELTARSESTEASLPVFRFSPASLAGIAEDEQFFVDRA